MGPKRTSMDGLLHKAYKMLYNLTHEADDDSYKRYNDKIKDKAKVLSLIKSAKGIVFVTEFKTSVLLSLHGGTGIVIAKNGNTWTGPHAVATSGIGFGFSFGGSSVDKLMILNSDKFVKAFASKMQFKLTGDAQITGGPVGRDATAGIAIGNKGVAPVYSYSNSRGLYLGLSVDTDLFWPRKGCDKKYYGNECTGEDILTGKVSRAEENENYEKLITLLDEIIDGKYDTAQVEAHRIKKEKKDKETAEKQANEALALGGEVVGGDNTNNTNNNDNGFAVNNNSSNNNNVNNSNNDNSNLVANNGVPAVSATHTSKPVAPGSAAPPPGFALVKHSYTPRDGEDQCMVINEGDNVQVLDDSTGEWWYGKNSAGTEGYFPQNAIDLSSYTKA